MLGRFSKLSGLTLCVVGLGCIVCTAIVSMGVGSMEVGTTQWMGAILHRLGLQVGWYDPDPIIQSVIVDIRMPRMLLGLFVGAALGLSGAYMQGVFRNALADPGLIGVSSGGALAASTFIVLSASLGGSWAWLGTLGTPAFAFLGALLATGFVWRLGTVGGRVMVSRLLLAGIAVNALVGAGIGCLTLVASHTELRDLVYWSLGSLDGASWNMVLLALLAVLPGLVVVPRLAPALDAWLLGEAEAGHLGIDVAGLKQWVIGVTALAVGTAVAVSGIIGFVGLVIPHAVRLVLGPSHRRLLLGSALLGAWFLMTADVIARVALAPIEVPIGVITALFGAPLFISLLRQSGSLGSIE